MEPPQRPARLDGPLLPLPYETDPVLLALVTPTRVIHHHKVAEDTEDCQREVLAGCGLSGRAHGADLEGGEAAVCCDSLCVVLRGLCALCGESFELG